MTLYFLERVDLTPPPLPTKKQTKKKKTAGDKNNTKLPRRILLFQVWFQNRRSKERRMKQLSALGARRHFFRGPRRMRALRAGMSPSELEESELMGPGFGYYNGE